MTQFKPPFPIDKEAKDSEVIPAGGYGWVKGRLGVGNVSPVPPDVGALGLQTFVVVRDPDNNPIYIGTAASDPDDPEDTYTSASPEYAGLAAVRSVSDAVTNSTTAITSATAAFTALDVGKLVVGAGIPLGAVIQGIVSGTQATLSVPATASASGVSLTFGEEIVGLYAEGYPGLLTGRFAIKLLIPSGAEQTWLSTTRHYSVSWQILKNGQLVSGTEFFDVGPIGVVLFGDEFVSNDEVLVGITTTLDPDQVSAIIEEAGSIVAADLLDECGFDIETAADLDPTLRIAIIGRARALIFKRDMSAGAAGGAITKMTEGGESVSFAGNASVQSADLDADALRRVVRFCKRTSSRYRPSFSVADRPVPRMDAVNEPVLVGPWVL